MRKSKSLGISSIVGCDGSHLDNLFLIGRSLLKKWVRFFQSLDCLDVFHQWWGTLHECSGSSVIVFGMYQMGNPIPIHVTCALIIYSEFFGLLERLEAQLMMLVVFQFDGY